MPRALVLAAAMLKQYSWGEKGARFLPAAKSTTVREALVPQGSDFEEEPHTLQSNSLCCKAMTQNVQPLHFADKNLEV